MRIGILTGGGDCPGLNAVIRAVVRKGEGQYGHNIVGYRHGWRGVMDGESMDLGVGSVRGLLPRGGTILGTSRTNPYKSDDGAARGEGDARRATASRALIAIGGEDTLGVAHKLGADGVQVVGVPKTIDNDLSATDFTFGFHTAVQIATDAIDRLHTTAESHDRVMVVEVMGRHAGWIATYAGLAGGADIILVPEEPFDIEEVCSRITHRHSRGRELLDRRRRRRRDAGRRHDGARVGRARRVRPRPPRRHRQPARRRDRAPHRLRSARDQPRPRAPRRQPDRVRPRHRDPVRHRGDRRGARGRVRRHGRAARHRRRPRPDRSGRRASSRPSTRSSTTPPPSSSADRVDRPRWPVPAMRSDRRSTLDPRIAG